MIATLRISIGGDSFDDFDLSAWPSAHFERAHRELVGRDVASSAVEVQDGAAVLRVAYAVRGPANGGAEVARRLQAALAELQQRSTLQLAGNPWTLECVAMRAGDEWVVCFPGVLRDIHSRQLLTQGHPALSAARLLVRLDVPRAGGSDMVLLDAAGTELPPPNHETLANAMRLWPSVAQWRQLMCSPRKVPARIEHFELADYGLQLASEGPCTVVEKHIDYVVLQSALAAYLFFRVCDDDGEEVPPPRIWRTRLHGEHCELSRHTRK
jgi:hypothetical protein